MKRTTVRALGGAALIVLATSLAYLPSLRGGFILDDDVALTDNPLIRAPDGLSRVWKFIESPDPWPLTYTTLWFEWRLWGLNSIGYHITNVLLHIVAACLIWVILWRLSVAGAFLAAVLFAVHPVNVESVAWIAQRKGLLAMLFFLLSIFFYVQSETRPPASPRGSPPLMDRWYGLSVAAFVLAMLSKGSVATLPVILLLIVWWLHPLAKRDLVRISVFFLVSFTLVSVNVWFQTSGADSAIRHAGFTERLLGAGAVVWFYLSKALLPVNLTFVYPQWHIRTDQLRWWLPLLAAMATTAALWRYRRRGSRPVLFAWGYFCCALVPVMGFTDVGFMQYSLVADHYQYLAVIGVTALVAAAWGTWRQRAQVSSRWAPNAVAVALGGLLTVLTWQQSREYADAMTLYRTTLEKNPDAWLAHINLGVALSRTGQSAEAIEHYEQALRLKPNDPDAHNDLGNALLQTGRLDEAIEHYERALRLKPNSAGSQYNLGNALAQAGQLAPAIGHFREALRLKPDYTEAHNDLGSALLQNGEIEGAVAEYEQVLRLKPDYAQGHYNLGLALTRAGQPEAAITHYQQALFLKPDYPEAHNSLGVVLANAGRLQEAIGHFQQALQLNPNDRTARANLEETISMKNTVAKPAE